MSRILLFLFLMAFTFGAPAATYYVRADGGTAAQCNGTANAPAGAAPNCAWSAPTIPLPMGTSDYGGVIPAALIKPGDTLQIAAGSYIVGIQAPGYVKTGSCYPGAPYECSIASVPSGIDAAHPTVIQGDCSATTELWGEGGVHGIIWLVGKHDIKLSCLSLTDHSTCIMGYGPTNATGGVTACNKNSTDPFAYYGLYAINDTNLTVNDVNIHGFANAGVKAGQLHGAILFNNVTIRANGWVGWDGDLASEGQSTSSDDGTLTFNNLKVEWNGCAEAYPATTIVGCWGQTNGGYGDGFGMALTAGDWTFNNATFYQNTSDGLDLLYHTLGGSITINGGVFWGSIGNQIKVGGNASITGAVVNGMCNNWSAYPVGGASGNSSNDCRAEGTAVVMTQSQPGETSSITYSTITGNGDTLLVGEGSSGSSGGGNTYVPVASNVWTYSNNIFLGQPSAVDTGANTALDWYSDGTFGGTVQYSNNLVWNTRNTNCATPGLICKDPALTDESLPTFNWKPLPGSPAIGAGVGVAQ